MFDFVLKILDFVLKISWILKPIAILPPGIDIMSTVHVVDNDCPIIRIQVWFIIIWALLKGDIALKRCRPPNCGPLQLQCSFQNHHFVLKRLPNHLCIQASSLRTAEAGSALHQKWWFYNKLTGFWPNKWWLYNKLTGFWPNKWWLYNKRSVMPYNLSFETEPRAETVIQIFPRYVCRCCLLCIYMPAIDRSLEWLQVPARHRDG